MADAPSVTTVDVTPNSSFRRSSSSHLPTTSPVPSLGSKTREAEQESCTCSRTASTASQMSEGTLVMNKVENFEEGATVAPNGGHGISTTPSDETQVMDKSGSDLEKGIPLSEFKSPVPKSPIRHDGHVWVDWDGPDDPANPLNWCKRRKWTISLVGILFCGLVSLSVSGYAIATGSVATDLHVSSELALAGITMFTVTFGAAPLVLAPFSEVYGRNAIYLMSAIIYALFFIPQALAKNIETLLICRFISGIAGSTSVSLVGGTLADVWDGSERGLPMAIFAFAAFAFTGVGPMMFGYVEQYTSFRIISWIMLGASSFFAIILFFILSETRASVLLSRKAERLRKETGDDKYKSRDDFERGSLIVMMRTSLSRPLKMLFLEPVLLSFAIWIAFVWGVLYILLSSIPLVFESVYGFSIGESGLAFSTQLIGSCTGLVVNHFTDKAYHRNVAVRGPEARLYTAMVGGVLLPLGSFIYAFTSYPNVHWIGPCIGISILYCGMYLIYLSCFSYLADAYTLYASSALSAQSFLRNLVGAVFPLFTRQLYGSLGIQGAGGLTAGLALALSVTPFLLFKFGARLRARSPFAKELERMKVERKAELQATRSRLSMIRSTSSRKNCVPQEKKV